jgi:hypothetical protein
MPTGDHKITLWTNHIEPPIIIITLNSLSFLLNDPTVIKVVAIKPRILNKPMYVFITMNKLTQSETAEIHWYFHLIDIRNLILENKNIYPAVGCSRIR